MTTLLDELKERLEAAKVRLTLAQQRHQAAQVELNAAAGEHNIWNAAVQIEIREEAARVAAAQSNQTPLPLTASEAASMPEQPDDSEIEEEHPAEPINKTELVRQQLRAHPMGMTTGDLWKTLREPISNRAYLYSILKRLRDNEEIALKRGKYLIRENPAEGKEESQSTLVQ